MSKNFVESIYSRNNFNCKSSFSSDGCLIFKFFGMNIPDMALQVFPLFACLSTKVAFIGRFSSMSSQMNLE